MNKTRWAILGVCSLIGLSPLLMAPSGGFPSSPTFQKVRALVDGDQYTLTQTTASADQKNWIFRTGGSPSGSLAVSTSTDASPQTAINNAVVWTRTGTTVTNTNIAQGTFTIGGVTAATSETGSFTATLTGYAANPTGTVFYTKVGNWVSLYVQASITGTSNAAAMTMTGLPAAIIPAHQKYGTVSPGCVDIGNGQMCGHLVQVSGTIIFSGIIITGCTNTAGTCASNAAWTATQNKGIGINWTTAYSLD